jgi:Rhodanese-related sulfurtransferase
MIFTQSQPGSQWLPEWMSNYSIILLVKCFRKKMAEKYNSSPDISNESLSTRMLYQTIRSRFPKVRQLCTTQLNKWLLVDNDTSAVLLVDVREKEEQDISSIKNAMQITPSDGTGLILTKIESCSVEKVVAFCSVGYRSCALIQQLYNDLKNKDRLDIELYNLEGGLFKWANEDKPIVNSKDIDTKYVHPYSVIWGKFLNTDRRKYSNVDASSNL